MTLFILIFAVVFLLILITIVRLNAFMALTITALVVGLVKGMPLNVLLDSVQKGIGSTLGGLVLVLGFGVMLGALLAETGAAHRIASQLVAFFGEKNAKIALGLTAFLVGIAMFYNAGFVVLIPLVFSIASNTGQPLVYLGVAMAGALSVTHGFLPPHPGPMGIVGIFKANVGKALLLGLIPATFAIIAVSIILPEFMRKIVANPPKGLVDIKIFEENEMPSFLKSIIVALSPVLLMAFGTIGELTLPHDSTLLINLKFFGDPSVSMLIGVLLAFIFLGNVIHKDYRSRMDKLMSKSSNALNAATMILLIIAAGGTFKQVLTDSGIGKDIASMVNDLGLPPLILGWFVATIVRIAVGSATLAGLTAAGIIQPILAANPSVSPELMVISIGAGSLMCSHVNDTGFWMFKEYFGLSLKDTFRSWTLMETLVGIVGLVSVLVMDIFI
jgi:Gnt-I system high-affinity gluconate transporter